MLGLFPEITDLDFSDVIVHPDKTVETAPIPIIFRKSRRFTWFIIYLLNVIVIQDLILSISDKK